MRGWYILVLMVILSTAASAQIFLGTVDGFVTHAVNGSVVEGANVTVSVNGKSGAGSSGDTLSQSNGYYVVTNLNLNNADTVTVNGNLSNRFDQETGTSNAFQTVQVNLSLVAVPFAPTITPVNDTHNNSIIFFDWTSGTDPDGLSTFDRFTLDGTTFNNSFPIQNRTFLSYSTHTWSVVTCNVFGCSTAAQDSFEIFNDPPPAPILEDEPDTILNNATLNWTSGGPDPENDTTFFQFQFDAGPIQSNVTPPFDVTGLSVGLHTWRVRECDFIECSSFSTDTFSVTNDPPSAPSLTPTADNNESFLNFTFTTGIDPENATVRNEFEFNFTFTNTNATSPQTVNVTGIVDFLTVRVRTCDDSGACSGYDTDQFIHYVCPPPAGVDQ